MISARLVYYGVTVKSIVCYLYSILYTYTMIGALLFYARWKKQMN
jgi:hypothetical protein